MTNPINPTNRGTNEPLNGNDRVRSQKSNDTASSPEPTSEAVTGDRVSLSAESLQLTELHNRLDSVPDIDEEKIASIKQAIAQGNYPLDAEKIAENLLNLEKALGE